MQPKNRSLTHYKALNRYLEDLFVLRKAKAFSRDDLIRLAGRHFGETINRGRLEYDLRALQTKRLIHRVDVGLYGHISQRTYLDRIKDIFCRYETWWISPRAYKTSLKGKRNPMSFSHPLHGFAEGTLIRLLGVLLRENFLVKEGHYYRASAHAVEYWLKKQARPLPTLEDLLA